MEEKTKPTIYLDKSPKPFYEPIDRLGDGTYARVIRARHKETKTEVAIKIISTSKLSYKDLERVQREVNIVSQLNHPNIAKVFEIYQDKTTKQTHIIQELLGGGNFLDFILNNGPITEPEACKLLRGVLLAVQYMHSLGFAHRDLKPENLVLNTEHTVLKLIDFGFSKSKNDINGLETPIGTPGWSSSDVMSGQPYSLAVDMWSMGCIVYFALSAVPPFNSHKTLLSEKVNELNQLIKTGTYTWPDNIEISATAKNFISWLLEKDPNVRMSATQALEHVWMTGKALSTSLRKADSQPQLNTQEKELLRQTINSAIDRARESADETAQNEDAGLHDKAENTFQEQQNKLQQLLQQLNIGVSIEESEIDNLSAEVEKARNESEKLLSTRPSIVRKDTHYIGFAGERSNFMSNEPAVLFQYGNELCITALHKYAENSSSPQKELPSWTSGIFVKVFNDILYYDTENNLLFNGLPGSVAYLSLNKSNCWHYYLFKKLPNPKLVIWHSEFGRIIIENCHRFNLNISFALLESLFGPKNANVAKTGILMGIDQNKALLYERVKLVSVEAKSKEAYIIYFEKPVPKQQFIDSWNIQMSITLTPEDIKLQDNDILIISDIQSVGTQFIMNGRLYQVHKYTPYHVKMSGIPRHDLEILLEDNLKGIECNLIEITPTSFVLHLPSKDAVDIVHKIKLETPKSSDTIAFQDLEGITNYELEEEQLIDIENESKVDIKNQEEWIINPIIKTVTNIPIERNPFDLMRGEISCTETVNIAEKKFEQKFRSEGNDGMKAIFLYICLSKSGIPKQDTRTWTTYLLYLQTAFNSLPLERSYRTTYYILPVISYPESAYIIGRTVKFTSFLLTYNSLSIHPELIFKIQTRCGRDVSGFSSDEEGGLILIEPDTSFVVIDKYKKEVNFDGVSKECVYIELMELRACCMTVKHCSVPQILLYPPIS